jgi:hypothetical protein
MYHIYICMYHIYLCICSSHEVAIYCTVGNTKGGEATITTTTTNNNSSSSSSSSSSSIHYIYVELAPYMLLPHAVYTVCVILCIGSCSISLDNIYTYNICIYMYVYVYACICICICMYMYIWVDSRYNGQLHQRQFPQKRRPCVTGMHITTYMYTTYIYYIYILHIYTTYITYIYSCYYMCLGRYSGFVQWRLSVYGIRSEVGVSYTCLCLCICICIYGIYNKSYLCMYIYDMILRC